MTQHSELPPELLTTSEGTWRVTRAWPGSGSRAESLALELTPHLDTPPDDAAGSGAEASPENQPENRLRAGWWTERTCELLTYGEDPKLPDLARYRAGTVVSHRPGKRAVVRMGEGSESEYVKVVRSGRAAGILGGVERASGFAETFRTPEVLEHRGAAVRFSAVAGRSLHDGAAFTAEEWTRAWSEVMHAWAQAVAVTPDPRRLPLIHRADAEVKVLRHWHHVTSAYVRDAEQGAHTVEHMAQMLSRLPAERLRLSHRDLHDKQLVWSTSDGPGLLDVDTACAADPAVDLGNLRAHAQWRVRQGVWSAEQAETVQLCVDQAADASGTPQHTVAVYERASLLRIGMVYAVRPRYAQLAAELRSELTPELAPALLT